MGRVVKSVKCPHHSGGNENTPSLKLYDDGGEWCFACNWYKPGDGSVNEYVQETRPKENLEETLSYIDTLPIKPYRGLTLPCDDVSAYIVWPCRGYYKRRFFTPNSTQPKYIGAFGHEKPLFVLHGNITHLIIVEGELNALSLKAAYPEYTIVSPGGASDMVSRKYDTYLPMYLRWHNLMVVVDDDEAGNKALLGLMGQLRARDPYKHIHTVRKKKPDANEILERHGCDRLKEEIYFKEEVEMQRGVCEHLSSM